MDRGPDAAPDTATPDLTPDLAADLAPIGDGGLQLGLVAHWKMDEGAPSATAADVTGNGNTATLTGPTWVAGPPLKMANPAALALDGVDDYLRVQVANMPAIEAPKTMAMWVKWDAPPDGNQNFLSLTNPGAGSSAQVGFRGGKLVAWRWGGMDLVSAPVAAPATGVWHHVAYTFDGTTHLLYLDGAQLSMATNAMNPTQVGPVTTAFMGLYDPLATGPERYKGAIDDVRLYNRPLSPAEITALFQGQ